jgi:hypothetical protein
VDGPQTSITPKTRLCAESPWPACRRLGDQPFQQSRVRLRVQRQGPRPVFHARKDSSRWPAPASSSPPRRRHQRRPAAIASMKFFTRPHAPQAGLPPLRLSVSVVARSIGCLVVVRTASATDPASRVRTILFPSITIRPRSPEISSRFTPGHSPVLAINTPWPHSPTPAAPSRRPRHRCRDTSQRRRRLHPDGIPTSH